MRTPHAIYRLTRFGKPLFFHRRHVLPSAALLLAITIALLVIGGPVLGAGLAGSGEFDCECPELDATIIKVGEPGRGGHEFVTVRLDRNGQDIKVTRRDLDPLTVGEHVRVRFLDDVPITLITSDGTEVEAEDHPSAVQRSLVFGGAAALALAGVTALLALVRWLGDRREPVGRKTSHGDVPLLKRPRRI